MRIYLIIYFIQLKLLYVEIFMIITRVVKLNPNLIVCYFVIVQHATYNPWSANSCS